MNSTKKLVSIIVPCFNEEPVLYSFYNTIMPILKSLDIYNFEILLIDDGSSDNSLNLMNEISLKDSRFKYLSFSRNFGKEAAMLAGLRASTGDYVTIMDSDLQDPPELLPEMLHYLESGYDSVATKRISRDGEPPIRSFFARMFYKLMSKISDIDLVDGARDYRMMTREMVNSILSLTEYHRFTKGIYGWIGFNTKWISYKNVERTEGETKWSFWSLMGYAIEGIVAFTTVPLRFASILGFAISIISFLYTIFIISKTLILGIDVPGYASIVSLLLFIGGIQLLAFGIIGEYVSRTYMEVKRRPNYIIKKSNINQVSSKINTNFISEDNIIPSKERI